MPLPYRAQVLGNAPTLPNRTPKDTMLYTFPPATFVIAVADYDRPYENPISVQAGETVRPVTDGSMETDFMGWTWCIGPDGRAGWTPDAWCQPVDDGWRLLRDFSALELTVRKGDRLQLLHGESGFLFCETETRDRAWIPDAVVELQS